MVMSLVSILSVVAFPVALSWVDDAKDVSTRQKLTQLREAIVGNPNIVIGGSYARPGFLNDVGTLPTSLTQLSTKGSLSSYDPFSRIGWRGPYIDASISDWNKDAWGSSFVYSSSARTLVSCGENKICGDSDDITVNF